MTPREYKEYEEEQRVKAQIKAEAWHVPLFSNGKRLYEAIDEMEDWKLDAKDVPWIIRFFENPRSLLCEFGIFPGCVNLFTHDCIHIMLGRGVLPKDEAFILGYTMGSTGKLGWFREKIFLFIARWLYPEGYKFFEEEAQVFQWGVLAGKRCNVDLTKVQFDKFKGMKISYIRTLLGVETKFIKVCYLLEKKAFPDSVESQRLL